jgi:hypothetical protein
MLASLSRMVECGKTEEFESSSLVPGEGLEPTSLLRAEDFKSSASANSAIPAEIKIRD